MATPSYSQGTAGYHPVGGHFASMGGYHQAASQYATAMNQYNTTSVSSMVPQFTGAFSTSQFPSSYQQTAVNRASMNFQGFAGATAIGYGGSAFDPYHTGMATGSSQMENGTEMRSPTSPLFSSASSATGITMNNMGISSGKTKGRNNGESDARVLHAGDNSESGNIDGVEDDVLEGEEE
ncbi:16224_t:CDS:2 [Entrophospora sp. SA101]|nr:16224_t:CDS:2 [Entrophospora sp. SA101]